ncbi:MAG: hypothetical protein E8D45_05850, partial [Nitrospira sp.]
FPEFTDTRGDGDDTVALLGATNYTVHGNGGNDHLQTAQGNDQLFGGAGTDTLIGNSGHDRLSGGTENDLLLGDSDDGSVVDGDDSLDGGAGTDGRHVQCRQSAGGRRGAPVGGGPALTGALRRTIRCQNQDLTLSGALPEKARSRN